MATDVESMMLVIEANQTKLVKDMAKINATFAKQAKQLEDRSKALNDRLGIKQALSPALSLLTSRFAALTAAIGSAVSMAAGIEKIRELANIADDAKKIGVTAEELQGLQHAADLAGGSAEQVTAGLVYFNKELGESGDKASKLAALFRENGVAMRGAQGNLLPYKTLLQSFAQIVSRAANDQEAASMAALGFGKAGADMLPVIRDMARGVDDITAAAKRAGVVVSDELVSRADEWDDEWNTAMKRLKSGLAEVMIETGLLSGGIDVLSSAVQTNAKAFAAWVNELKSNVMVVLGPLVAALSTIDGYMKDMERAGLEAARSMPQEVIDAFPEYKAMGLRTSLGGADAKSSRDELWKPTGNADARVESAFSLFDAKKPPSKMPKFGGGSAGGDIDELEREIQALREKGAALAVEIEMVGKSTEEREKALEMQKLKTAADRAEIALTPEKLAQMEALAGAYAAQVAQLERMKKSEEETRRAYEHLGETAVDALADIMIEGRNAGEVMQQLAKSIARAALQALLMGSGPLGGLFGGGLLKMAFGGSGGAAPLKITPFATGGVVRQPTVALAGESGPEAFVPLANGRIPVRLSLPSPRAIAAARSSSSMSITFAPVVDARGASMEAVIRLERGLKDMAASLPKRITDVLHRQRTRGVAY